MNEVGAAGDPGWQKRELERIEDVQVPMPHTGELVRATDLPHVAAALDELVEHKQRVKDAERWLIEILDAYSAQSGEGRTLHLGGVTVELSSRDKLEWDIPALGELLAEAGLPQERIDQLIVQKVTQTVSLTVAKQLRASSEEYAHVLDACQTRVPATVYVRGIRR